jgi:hypothetical protein
LQIHISVIRGLRVPTISSRTRAIRSRMFKQANRRPIPCFDTALIVQPKTPVPEGTQQENVCATVVSFCQSENATQWSSLGLRLSVHFDYIALVSKATTGCTRRGWCVRTKLSLPIQSSHGNTHPFRSLQPHLFLVPSLDHERSPVPRLR